ncbi:hypothetical protein V6Z92_003525 [Aspergillus fumigatus]
MVNPRRTNDRDDDRHEDVSETPLVNVAAGRGYEGVLKLLLDFGASPNESRQFPRVPLSLAIQYGHDAAVRVLLAREDTTVTLPSAPFSQQPLHFALGRGSLECVLLLIERGADLQQYESTGSRALYPAISSGSHALVEFLVNRGCNPLGCCGYTALSLAAVMGHQSLVRYFLAQGVDPEIRDRTGFTALGHAAKAGHADVVETLLEWGVRRDNVGEDGARKPRSGCGGAPAAWSRSKLAQPSRDTPHPLGRHQRVRPHIQSARGPGCPDRHSPRGRNTPPYRRTAERSAAG